jgi:monoamine oxidase
VARSDAFTRLKRLGTVYRAAARSGLPVEEFLQAREAAEDGLTRRNLLKLGAAAGGGALVLGATGPATATAAPRRSGSPRVVVVGAGIAGLTAALGLQDAGIPATVYEATERAGGRMFSERDYWDDRQTSEYGGELIDSDHQAILALCARFRLPLVDVEKAKPAGSRDVLHFDGGYYPSAQLARDFAPVYQALRADVAAAGDSPTWDSSNPAGVALSRMSVAEWIDTRVPGGRRSLLGRFIDDAYVVEYGAESGDQTAVNVVYQLSGQSTPEDPSIWGFSDERFRIRGGNQTLPEAVAAALPPGSVRHGWELLAVARNSDGTQTLTFEVDGSCRTVRADHTILAIPLGVLQRIDLGSAGFDRRMRGSIAALRMGHCTKLNLQLKSRVYLGSGPWPGPSNGRIFSDAGFQQCWDATWGQPGRKGILIQYGGGDGARRFQPPEPFLTSRSPYVRSAAEQVLDTIDPVIPGVRREWIGKATLSAWHLNPHAYGAYSCYPVDYCHRYAGYEAQQQGNIHLAGEHTSTDSQGFMNGGVSSGQRAAAEVINDLK